ncbi:MAG TPA: helix-turn-helix domain-containing protein [Deltaproteobacteria bacterium]|nr:helix-turn-helix domain-containing protein [Deltaproteobacteria bacterium]
MAKGDKQEMIIDAALEVFRERGYANARMADIARRAGVSYGLVYHYFGSKEAV